MKRGYVMRLVDGPSICGYVVQHNEQEHLLIINGEVILLTPIEYVLFMQLLAHFDKHLTFALLINSASSSCSGCKTRRALTLHISKLRIKLLHLGLDISCNMKSGYLLSSTSITT